MCGEFMETVLIGFAVVTLIIGLVCGLLPIFSGIKDDKDRLKQLTGIAAGIIIASAMLVVIPEGYELAMTDEHGDDAALAGSTALVILEWQHGEINATDAIEEIEGLLGGHEGHDHDEHEEDHGVCHDMSTHQNTDHDSQEDCESAGNMWMEEHEESDGGTCHDTGTHQNTEHDNQEDCESAGNMWMEEDEEEHGHEGHGHDSESSLSDSIGEVIEEVEEEEINATTGLMEIEELISTHGHEESHSSHDDHTSGILMGGAIIAGFLLMFILEGSGIGHAVHEEHHEHENSHGHGHVHHAAAGGLLVFGLTLHAATDGVAIGAAAATGDFALTITVLLAVLIHKGPAAFSLGVFSTHEREERNDSIRDVVIFSLATPIMIIVAGLALSELETHMIGLAMLFSAGTFLYVATVDTLPDIHNPETGRKAMINVLIGVVILVILLFIANAMDLGHAH